MTEAEWLACKNPRDMMRSLDSKATERKLRLFACACYRRIWSHLTEKPSRYIVEVSERYADGKVTEERLNRAWEKADVAFQGVHLNGGGDVEQTPAQAVIGLRATLDVHEVAEFAAATYGAIARGEAYEQIWQSPGKTNEERWAEDGVIRRAAEVEEERVQAALLRDIFGNPLRLMVADPAWLTFDVVALARGIYDERAFDRLPILADALQDAGCNNADVLAHCRDPQLTHVRGCWVVDRVLGKS